MYFFLFGKLSQYLAEEIHTRRRRLPTEENREEFKLGFHVCLISSLQSLSAYIAFSFSKIRAQNWLLAQTPPGHFRFKVWLTNRSNFHGQNKPKLMFLLMKVLPVWFFVCQILKHCFVMLFQATQGISRYPNFQSKFPKNIICLRTIRHTCDETHSALIGGDIS